MIIAKELKGKLKNIQLPVLKKCAVAYSGGLDSSLGIELLRRIYKVREIIPITVDVGQGKDEIDLAVRRAGQLKIDPLIIDCKHDFSENWLKKAIRANSDYYGYPVSTSMTRQLIAETIASKAAELGCDSILEGSIV
jgi:argininosuccinate synthase